jgi:hypothetical protein
MVLALPKGKASLPRSADVTRASRAAFRAHDADAGRAAAELLEALVGQRDAERAVLLQARGDAGLGFEPGVELLGVLGEARQVLGGPELSDQAGGMPGGAAGELLALEQHDVAPAEPGARW